MKHKTAFHSNYRYEIFIEYYIPNNLDAQLSDSQGESAAKAA